MPIQPGAVVNTQSFGNRPENLEVPHIDTRAPTTSDVNYPIGKHWLYQGDSEWVLVNLVTINGVTTATWIQNSNSTSGLVTSVTGTANQIAVSPTTGAAIVSFPTNVTFNAGNFSVPAAGASTITLGGATETGDINLGVSTTGQNINIGVTGAGANVIGIGNNTNGTSVTLTAFSQITIDAPAIGVTGNVNLSAGKISLTNAAATTGAMTAGAITVANPLVSTNSIIMLTHNTLAGTPGALSAPQASIVNGVSFDIVSSSNTDTSTVNYIIFN